MGDLAAGAYADDQGGPSRGAVWILFLHPAGMLKSHQKINDVVGGFTNPPAYSVLTPPALGTDCWLSIATTGKTGSFLAAYTMPTTVSTIWGNLLVDVTDPSGELLGWPAGTGDPTVLQLPIPDDPVLCSFPCATQAIRFGGGFDLTNAQDLVLGR